MMTLNSEWRYAECHNYTLHAESHHAERRYAECCYAECRGAVETVARF